MRPLFDDGATAAQEATRDYVLKLEARPASRAMLNIFGGKLTTYRRLSEHALEKIEQVLGAKGKPWTAGSHLPGGDFPATGYDDEVKRLSARHPYLPARHAKRLVRLYGTKALVMLGEARSLGDLGQHFGSDLYGVEVDWLVNNEWARTAEDVLWRRTKKGLYLGKAEVSALQEYLMRQAPA